MTAVLSDLQRTFSTLVLAEHDRGRLKRATRQAITLAQRLGSDFGLLVAGHGVATLAEELRSLGASVVLVADHAALADPVADRYAALVAEVARAHGVHTLLAASSTFARDLLPRAAALLDAPMLTDVTAVETIDGVDVFHRPLSAGRVSAAVRLAGELRVLMARGSAFAVCGAEAPACPVARIAVDPSGLPAGTVLVSRADRVSARPDLTEARVVVSGGRPLKDAATFERLVGGLADVLGGAVGATRAAVDAGLVSNDCQIGQTGKVVAPELYIAVGVSGAIQHLAGIADSKVIVAINRDPEAPIFQMATYGLVGDLFELVPQLIAGVGALPSRS